MSIAIVGGGIIGCAIAWRLAARGASVTLLERLPDLGREASFAAGGILAPQAESKGPGPLLTLGVESRRRFPAFVEALVRETGIDPELDQRGLLEVAHHEEEARALQQRAHTGHGAEWLSAAEVARLEPALALTHGGLYFPAEGALDPRLLTRALAQAAQQRGARLLAGIEVREIVQDGSRVAGLRLANGETLPATRVVLCAGSWTSLLPGARLRADAVYPVRGQMLLFGTNPARLSRTVYSAKGYLVPRRDGRVLAGSTMEAVGFVNETTAPGLSSIEALAHELMPALAHAPRQDAWSGLRPASADGLPLVGRSPVDGLYLASGHFRNGVLLAPLTADALAALLYDEDPGADLSAVSPARFWA